MRVRSLLAAVALLATTAFAVEVSTTPDEDTVETVVETGEPNIDVVLSFPESNPFGHIVNGEQNHVFLNIENKSHRNVTLLTVAGAFHDAQSDKLIKATNNLTYGIYLVEGAKIRLPYSFYSEFKTGDIKLNLYLQHLADGEKYRIPAHESIVTVVEPEFSIFDIKLLTTYATVAALLGGLGYIAYATFAPASAKPKRVGKSTVSAPVGAVKATGAGGYQEEWIPEHHLKKPRKGKGALSSADEQSGAEMSGAEGKRRKGRK
ncbi:hypothetical protein EVG20_g7576 [Dentipellis fragilis]|uniref:Translocon-associated protein subunit alpha n=1 Tax=Dentipellis fragilis TaxID=205917 RepID=A0A4Y9YEN6_9AGAM|nr:hypothetical protein EVG20_g7576 [Dentipellis fragilis]